MRSQPVLELHVNSPAGGFTRRVLPGRFTLGRSSECGLTLNDVAISRVHAEFQSDEQGQWWVKDLNSHNGVWVEGHRLDGSQPLFDGMAIVIGGFTLSIIACGQPANQSISESEQTFTLMAGDSPQIDAGHIEAVLALGKALNSEADARQRARLLCAAMVSSGFRGTIAAIVEPARESDQRIVVSDRKPHSEASALRLSESLLRNTCRHGRPVMASNMPSPHQNVAMTISRDSVICAAAACPLDDACTCLLYVQLPADCGTMQWLALMSLAASQWRQSEANWRATQAGNERAAMEAELKRAATIQQRLLPRNAAAEARSRGLDVATLFRPSLAVGGDYLDVIGRDDRLMLIIADVCGKGMQAAMIAAACHTVVHVIREQDIVDMVHRLNAHLEEFMPDGSFATAILGEIDKAGRFRWINAGHPPPMVRHADGTVSTLGDASMSGDNLPLGVMPCERSEWISREAQLAENDVLVLYSDGISELPIKGGLAGAAVPMLGIEGFIDVLQRCDITDDAEALSKELDISLRQVVDIHQAGDDMTILLCRRGG